MKNHNLVLTLVLNLLLTVAGIATADSQKVSGVYVYTDMTEAFLDIGQQAGVRVICTNNINASVSVEFSDMEFDQAMEMLCRAGNLQFRQINGYYIVGPADSDEMGFDTFNITQVATFNVGNPTDFVRQYPAAQSLGLQASEGSNRLIVTGPSRTVLRVMEDIKKFDVRPGQVMVQAIIVETSIEDDMEFGIDMFTGEWGESIGDGAFRSATLGPDLLLSGSYLGDGMNLFGSLRAMMADGKAWIRSSPRVQVMDGQTANMSSEEEMWFDFQPEVDGNYRYSNTRIENIRFGTRLEVTPQIGDDGIITVKIKGEVGDIIGRQQRRNNSNDELPIINRRTFESTSYVEDGGIIVLGGLQLEETREVKKRVPLLGHIPILGWLFTHSEEEVDQREIKILIRPKTVGFGSQEHEVRGTEARLDSILNPPPAENQ